LGNYKGVIGIQKRISMDEVRKGVHELKYGKAASVIVVVVLTLDSRDFVSQVDLRSANPTDHHPSYRRIRKCEDRSRLFTTVSAIIEGGPLQQA